MSSPCPPRRSADMSSTEHPSSMAMNARKRATSSAPAWPRMRCVGNFDAFQAVYTIASSGLETMIIIALGRMLGDAFRDRLHDLDVGGDQIIAAHAWLARNTGRNHDDIGIGGVGVIRCPGDSGIKALDRRALCQIEHLAFDDVLLFGNVENNDVAKFPLRRPTERRKRRHFPRRQL